MFNKKPSFRFAIDNFSEKESMGYSSEIFVSGGCEWSLVVYPKGDSSAENQYMSLFLRVANPKSLQTGWKRIAKYYFVVLNQSDELLFRSSPREGGTLFCAESPGWSFSKTLLLSKIQDDKIIIEVYINVLEAVDGEAEDASKKNETVDIKGFQVLASQVTSVAKLFVEQPDVAEDFKVKNKALKTSYMNVLLKLVKKLEKPLKSLSETKLSKARGKLSELMDVGFNLGWLESKLDEISLEKKKLDDESRVQKMEEFGFKLESLKTKLDEVSLERKKADAADGSLFQQLDNRVKNLELNEAEVEHLKTELYDLKTEFHEVTSETTKEYSRIEERIEERVKYLKAELDEVSLERKKEAEQLEERLKNLEVMELGCKVENLETKLNKITLEMNDDDEDDDDDEDEDWGEQLEERVKNLEEMELSLKTKLDEVSLEVKKLADDDDEPWVDPLEVRVNNLEAMELSLKTKLDEVSLEMKKVFDSDESWQSWGDELEERVDNLEVKSDSKLVSLKMKLDEVSSERTKENSRAKVLEERLKNLEVMELGCKVENLEAKLNEITLDMNKEERVKNLEEMKLGCMIESLKTEIGEVSSGKTELGYKIESLKTELDKVSSERTKENYRAEELEERLKNLEGMELGCKVENLKTKLKKSEDANKVKNLEVKELECKVDCLNRKLEEVSLKMKKSDNLYECRIKQLEESIKNFGMMQLGFKVSCLNAKLEEFCLEKKKSDAADESRFEDVEDSVKNIELMVSYLKGVLDKKKDKSSDDGFLLVNESIDDM
ncbi:hypothetical protein AALP_AA4G212600 [Arabis alpina]|uniref:MATH domain-containing protein n=1 Tax=Arabis alpina TaxID=50452 RepID=A0A087H4P4_ARAAL|nr:hypothetical protein AALP_AA4G212600 [Arabis alpina]